MIAVALTIGGVAAGGGPTDCCAGHGACDPAEHRSFGLRVVGRNIIAEHCAGETADQGARRHAVLPLLLAVGVAIIGLGCSRRLRASDRRRHKGRDRDQKGLTTHMRLLCCLSGPNQNRSEPEMKRRG
jgi:hypothetical protein